MSLGAGVASRARGRRHGVVTIGLAAVLAGCGGGGGGSSPATLDAGNAVAISAEVLQSMQVVGDLGISSGGALGQAGPAGGAEAQRLRNLSRRTIQQLRPSIAVGPVTEPCIVSGTVRFSGNVANPDTLSTGDSISATFSNCNDGDGEVVTGGLRLVVLQYAGDLLSDQFSLRADATFTNLRVTVAGETFGADGLARIELDTLSLPNTSSISGAGVTATIGSDRRTLADFAIDVVANPLPVPSTTQVSGTGTLQSNGFSGFVDFVTIFPLQAAGSSYPGSGEVEILGAGNARIRVVILDATNVEVRLDLDGNGSAEEVIATTWAALEGIAPGAGVVVYCICGGVRP
jgi:hypothetical protein